MTTNAPRTTWPIRVFHLCPTTNNNNGQKQTQPKATAREEEEAEEEEEEEMAKALYNERSNRLGAENENYKMEYIIHIKHTNSEQWIKCYKM